MTSSIKSILDELKARKVRITVEGDKLQVEAPKGTIDGRLQELIKLNKAALISYIQQARNNENTAIPAAPLSDSYVLSSSQRRLWILSQFEEGSMAYNIPGIYLFEGVLNIPALERAFEMLIARHEILRTVFREDAEGIPRQYIRAAHETGFKILQDDLRSCNDLPGKIAQLLDDVFMQAFSLSTDALIRAGLYRTDDNSWLLISSFHHIISDGWSMNILLNELMRFYHTIIQGVNIDPGPLRIQYKDYAVWQQQQLKDQQLDIHKHYWTTKFKDSISPLRLLGDRPRPAVRTHRGGVIMQQLNSTQTNELKLLLQENGATLFMGLLAIVHTLLYRYTGQEEMVIGTLVAGRGHPDLEDQIGFYVNTLALRASLNGNNGFQALLDGIKKTAADAYMHQDYPLDELIEELNLERDTSRHALFDVLVVLQPASTELAVETAGGDLRVSRYDSLAHNGRSKFDLSFDFIEKEEGIQLSIEYNNDIYLPATAARMGAHLEQLLIAILRNPDHPLALLDYLNPREKQQLLEDFNNTDALVGVHIPTIAQFAMAYRDVITC